ncbi:CAP domain-containing protein [Companilactobacillus halodurans]|uniref:CAP domain-containing protein n=1 Tax=Companilactobacillus halodurans TaxID=2584183 RepID=A0A5P0ZNA5_9LACO|nr:CAP domain-containing protein [Companilactobacillus halodurans]MQS75321.1 hypothetical protein [Companilactobacillus halodurans]MQS97398.1 hypothetical protein [Companilactobacillus halodurans]
MKLSISKSAGIIAALAMATTGTLLFNQNDAKAATVATVHSGSVAQLYTEQGEKVTNRALAPNSPWVVGKILTINNQTMYQVATNEYLRAADSSLNGETSQDTGIVVHVIDHDQALYNDATNSNSNRALQQGTAWKVGKIITNKNGDTFFQVSTHEYIKGSFNVILNSDKGSKQYIADFGINDSDSSSNNNSNNSGNTSTGTNDNNSGSSSQQETSTPNISAVNTAVLNSINKERTSNGEEALTEDSSLMQAASIRAKEVSELFSHTRPDGTNAQTVLKQVGNTSTYYGENLFGTPWNQLSVQTPEHYAYVVMDNYKGESGTENHYVNLMRPKFTKVGIGSYYAQDGTLYVAEEFTK